MRIMVFLSLVNLSSMVVQLKLLNRLSSPNYLDIMNRLNFDRGLFKASSKFDLSHQFKSLPI